MGCLVSRYIAAGRSQATIGHLLLMVEAGLVAGAGGEDESSAVARSHPAVTASSTHQHSTQGHVRLSRICIVSWLLMSEETWNGYF